MPTRHGRLLPVLVSALLLVGAANLGAYAATGGPLLLGKSNVAGKTTTLKNSGNGAALKLKTKKTVAPFKVSSKTKVKKLNADLLDGKDSTDLATKSYVYELAAGPTTGPVVSWSLTGLPVGAYQVGYTVPAETPGSIGCYLRADAPGMQPIQLPSFTAEDADGIKVVSAAGHLPPSPAGYALTCFADGGTLVVPATIADFTATVSLTPIDSVIAGTATPQAALRSAQRGFGS